MRSCLRTGRDSDVVEHVNSRSVRRSPVRCEVNHFLIRKVIQPPLSHPTRGSGVRFRHPLVSNVMITTLPTLSYNPTGFVWAKDFHSSAYTRQRAFPRIDLQDLILWDTFEKEINNAITTRMSA